MIEISAKALGRPESISLASDHLCVVIESFHGAVVDGRAEIVHQAILMAWQLPGKVPHGFEARMGCPPEPTIEIAFCPSCIGIGPELTESFFGSSRKCMHGFR